MRNLIGSIATYTLLTAILALTAFGMANNNQGQRPTYRIISPARDYLHLGEDGQRRFYADPISTLPGYSTGFHDPDLAEDRHDDDFDSARDEKSEIHLPEQAFAEIP